MLGNHCHSGPPFLCGVVRRPDHSSCTPTAHGRCLLGLTVLFGQHRVLTCLHVRATALLLPVGLCLAWFTWHGHLPSPSGHLSLQPLD